MLNFLKNVKIKFTYQASSSVKQNELLGFIEIEIQCTNRYKLANHSRRCLQFKILCLICIDGDIIQKVLVSY